MRFDHRTSNGREMASSNGFRPAVSLIGSGRQAVQETRLELPVRTRAVRGHCPLAIACGRRLCSARYATAPSPPDPKTIHITMIW